jgi:nucleotide-binding universal stress UspA family protein
VALTARRAQNARLRERHRADGLSHAFAASASGWALTAAAAIQTVSVSSDWGGRMIEALNRILVASDLSPYADDALTRASRLAHEHGAALTVLNVVERVLGADAPPENLVKLLVGEADDMVPALKQQAAQRLRDKLAALAPGRFEIAVRVGAAFLEIIHQAREQGCELIALGAHGGHYLKDWLLGSTAERVVRKGDRPVLVVKRSPRAPYRRVLAAVDFSDTARRALSFALRLAPKARVTLLNVYDLSQAATASVDRMTSEEFLRLQGEFESAQRVRLGALASEIGIDPDKATCLVRYGYPGTVINAVIAELRTDLVVIGTRGLTGVQHLLLGSVAEHVLRESRCDVLTVPPAAIRFALP